MWQIDYWLRCDLCESVTHMDGANLSQAIKTARSKGWHVNGKHATCNVCIETHRIAVNFRNSVAREIIAKKKLKKCPDCHGRGGFNNAGGATTCSTCEGTGRLKTL